MDELSAVLNKLQNVVAEPDSKTNQKKQSVSSVGGSTLPALKGSKREGSQRESHDITGMKGPKKTWSPPTQATKHSRRTTSLLNLFMSNPHGM